MTLQVLADANIPAVEACLGDLAQVSRFEGRRLDRAALAGVDALLVRSITPVNRALVAGTGLRFVGTATSGFDHVDRGALAEAGIGFAHAPGSNANAVVEYVLAAVAALGSHLEGLLQGGQVGVVGYGQVGRALVARLEGLGVSCRVFDPWLEQDSLPGASGLVDVLCCPVVSLHCELTRELPWPSEHLLGPAELLRLPRGGLLINASRGAVVDNRALLRVLAERPDLDVVLDVWEGEPDIRADLLEQVALGTAHIAGYSLDGKYRGTGMICRALLQDAGLGSDLPGPGLPPAPALRLAAGVSGAALVRALLRQRYDILRDDALLRGAVIGAGRVEARERFDRLRREYPERRELAGSGLTARELKDPDRALLIGLGCVVNDAGAVT
jgi:erythronate-4-phosphate dehydrogenase